MNYLEIERGIKHAESSVADRTSSDPHRKTSASKACDEHAQVHTQVERVGELSQHVWIESVMAERQSMLDQMVADEMPVQEVNLKTGHKRSVHNELLQDL